VGSSLPSWALRLINGIERLGKTHLDDDNTFVETYGDLIGVFEQRNTPSALEGITRGPAVQYLDDSIFASTDDDREVGMDDSERNVVRMTSTVCTQLLLR